MTNSINFNSILSNEMISTVFSYIPLSDLRNIFSVCKTWKLFDDESFWKRRAQEMRIHEIGDIPEYIKKQGSKSSISYYSFQKQSNPNITDSIFGALRSTKGIPEFKVYKSDDFDKLMSDIFESYFKKKKYKTCSINIQINFEKKQNKILEVSIFGQSLIPKQFIHHQIIKKITCYNGVEDSLSKYDLATVVSYDDRIYLKNKRILKMSTVTQNSILYHIVFDIIHSVANGLPVTTILDSLTFS